MNSNSQTERGNEKGLFIPQEILQKIDERELAKFLVQFGAEIVITGEGRKVRNIPYRENSLADGRLPGPGTFLQNPPQEEEEKS